MSTNSKNIIRNAYMSNFTTKKKHRYILTEKGSDLDTYIQQRLTEINDGVNSAIQELSMRIWDRQLPYVIIEKLPINFDTINDKMNAQDDKVQRVRCLLRDVNTERELIACLRDELSKDEFRTSHAIELYAHTTYNVLTFSNNNFDAKVLLDGSGLKSIFTDIFMDSAMFNSYSFLKNMSGQEKHDFGIKKLEFYQSKQLTCYYRFDNEDEEKTLYYSLAFSCRKGEKEFDYDMYISLWNEFVARYYPNERHKEKRVAEQLKQYIDPEQLPSNLEDKIMSREEGAYLVLRINNDRTKELHEYIMNYFGISEYRIGSIKIVNISEYSNITKMLKNLDVAAYKVVRVKKRTRGKNTVS